MTRRQISAALREFNSHFGKKEAVIANVWCIALHVLISFQLKRLPKSGLSVCCDKLGVEDENIDNLYEVVCSMSQGFNQSIGGATKSVLDLSSLKNRSPEQDTEVTSSTSACSSY